MKKSIIKLAKNKWVFYFFVALAIINVLGYFSVKAWECMVLFAAVAYSVNCYANNGTLAILGGLFVSNFVFGCNRVKEGFFEGMEHGDMKASASSSKDCCDVDCICPCTSVTFLNSNNGSPDILGFTEAIVNQGAEHPKSMSTSLFRPPIFA